MQDKDLIKKIQAGDINAFKQLFEKYHANIYNLCFRFASSKEEAEYLCQEVFLKIYNSAKTFSHRSQLSTWIYRITVNLCLNHQRQQKKFNWLFFDDSSKETITDTTSHLSIPNCDLPDSLIEQKEKEKIIQKAINGLPSKQRTAFILQRYENMSVKDISEILDSSVLSIQSRLARAKENLCKKLLPYLKNL